MKEIDRIFNSVDRELKFIVLQIRCKRFELKSHVCLSFLSYLWLIGVPSIVTNNFVVFKIILQLF